MGQSVCESVDRPRFSDPHTLDPKYPTEGVEVMVIVQDPSATPSGCCSDQVIGGRDTSLAS